MKRLGYIPWQRLIFLSITLMTGPSAAHDFWIEPATFCPEAGTLLPIRLRVGPPFRGDTYPRNPRHLKQFVLAGPDGEQPVLGHYGSDPAGYVQINTSRSPVLGYHSTPTVFQIDAKKFVAYLHEEGLEHIPGVRSQHNKPIREAFSRCAKAILASDSGYNHTLGFPLELIPEQNPYLLKPGDKLPVRILYQGQPLPGARIAAIHAANPDSAISTRSDANGRVRLQLDHSGDWLIKSVHLIPGSKHLNTDWESIWASLTFTLPEEEE